MPNLFFTLVKVQIFLLYILLIFINQPQLGKQSRGVDELKGRIFKGQQVCPEEFVRVINLQRLLT